MRVTCPACGAQYDLEAAISDADARRFADLVASLHPRVARPLIQYLALFRPSKTGMRWSRMLSLAQELAPMIHAASITRNGTAYAAPLELWESALRHLADRPPGLKLPLKTHGYLLEIIAGQAEKAAARTESEREQQRRRISGQRSGGPARVGSLISEPPRRTPPPPGWADGIRQQPPEEDSHDDATT